MKQDVTNNKEYSKEQLAVNIINSTNEAIIVANNCYKVTLMNYAAQNLTGLSANQGNNANIRDLIKDQPTLLYLVDIAMLEGRSISDREIIYLDRPYEQSLPIQGSASPLYSNDGIQLGAILILHDASNLKQIEQDGQLTDKLAMLETLAAGLAHEIKNPLGGIRGAAQLLAMELEQRQDLAEYTQIMIKETDRINDIIEELMDLTTPRSEVLSEVNLARVIGDIVLLQAQTTKGQAVKFDLQLDPSIPPIIGDKTLLTRLFLNLIKNATEAIQQGGTITLSTRIGTEHHLTSPGRAPVPFVVVKIIDNGPGIPQEILQKIFTPFFTTKSNGSGLGLAISQKIVADHDGILSIDSSQDHGTRCTISLPFRRVINTNNLATATLE
jgi:two-component system nitrogen regulation sensor histidine kinase GlnL